MSDVDADRIAALETVIEVLGAEINVLRAVVDAKQYEIDRLQAQRQAEGEDASTPYVAWPLVEKVSGKDQS